MSSESQHYSLHNQAIGINEYAEQHGFGIVRTYSDEEKSGVTLRNRHALRQLLSDVVAGRNDYRAILVYDVSRWGRFQDTDESAHYEFICKSAGVAVHYCAEPFANDSTLGSSLMKTLKRSMAAEFSRELGVKVFQGKRRIAALGFNVGGRTPYGFRRQIVSEEVQRQRVLNEGERKSSRSERLTLVFGPPHEVDAIRDIFAMVLKGGMTAREIARLLNSRDQTFNGKRWTKADIEYILTNPEYAGCNRWGRTSQRLGVARSELPSDQWIVKPNSFPQMVEKSDFERVQTLLRHDNGRKFWTKERIVAAAGKLLEETGSLSLRLFNSTPTAPSSSTLRSLDFVELCHHVGYEPSTRFVGASKAIKERCGYVKR
jgi:DNA invertase Pin-like site-specific DNA recombinase